jgi:hypothetical protein
MERHTLFVQTTPDLFQNDSLCSSPNTLGSTANQASPSSGQSETRDGGNSSTLKSCPLSNIYIRRERQTFTRLPTSDAILFTVRTFMTPLTSLGDEEFTAFIEQAKGWEGEMAAYKGREQWWDTVRQYYEERRRAMVGGK